MLRNSVQGLGGCLRQMWAGHQLGVGRCVQQVWAPEQQLHIAATRLCKDEVNMHTQRVERLEKTLNQVELLGRVGSPPEMRGTEEHPVVTFSIATHTNFRRGEDLIQQTDWHRIAVFKPYLREAVYRYLRRGQRVMVQGRIGYLERRDEESNQIVMKTATIVANEVIFFTKSETSSTKESSENI